MWKAGKAQCLENPALGRPSSGLEAKYVGQKNFVMHSVRTVP